MDVTIVKRLGALLAAVIVAAVLFLISNRGGNGFQHDPASTTEATAARTGARVLPTDPPLKIGPK